MATDDEMGKAIEETGEAIAKLAISLKQLNETCRIEQVSEQIRLRSKV